MSNLRMHLAPLATLALMAGVTACGGDEPPVASDPSASATTTPEPTATSGDQNAAPEDLEPGQYPDFEPSDYTYVVRLGCFCPDANVPIRVTVADGQVVKNVYAESTESVQKGEDAGPMGDITIQGIIDAANVPENAQVVLDWPAGQEYPSSVSIDRDEMIVDEEVTYTIESVDPG